VEDRVAVRDGGRRFFNSINHALTATLRALAVA
jgi:hypothetical protein